MVLSRLYHAVDSCSEADLGASRAGPAIAKTRDFRTSHCLYRKPVFPVHLEMRVDSKHRNVGFLALSGRCTVTSLTTASSHKETFAVLE